MAITKKKNGKYQVRVYVGYDKLTGKRQAKYATCDTMREARLKEAQLITDVETGELVPEWEKPKEPRHLTFDEAYAEWFDIYKRQGRTDATVSTTKYYFEHYLLTPELFGGMYLDCMIRKVVQQKVNRFIPTLTSSKQILSYAKMMIRWAVDSDDIACDDNPFEHVQMVQAKKAKRREVKYYDESQIKLFESGIYDYFQDDPKMTAVYIVLLRTGMRVGELLGLQWENIDFENDIITLNGRMTFVSGAKLYEDGLKNGTEQRVIEIDNVVHNVLQKWRTEQIKNTLSNGSPINKKSYIFEGSRSWIGVSLRNFNKWYNDNHSEQLPYLNVHGFRHTHASLLLSNGVDLKKVSERLGHKDITITANIYADVTPKARREVADKFSEIMGDNA
ncbi:site-specific integrase [Weissella minor]|uniref:tyrosine-type recombinase/integrase n=1 Tax=Weissella minor TaxID=1620 RepID=UPI001BB0CF51|nr:site-specific integrase [Weissella minor]MBS0949616.1 site-specific integrase [Weissella minor]